MKLFSLISIFILISIKSIAQPLGYSYGKVITINSAIVTGTNNLTDFPLLYSVTDPDLRTIVNGGKVTNSSGYDIVFTDATCLTTLKHEVEEYNPLTGKLVCWIKIPTLNYSINTIIHMYYGNSTVTISTSSPLTWSSDYSAVLHLNQDPTSVSPQMKDATIAANSGTCQGSMTGTNSITGKISSGLQFDEIDDRIEISDFDYTESFTISFWFNLSEVVGAVYQYLFSHGTFNTNHATNIYVGEDNTLVIGDRKMQKCLFQDSNDAPNTTALDAGNTYVNGSWHYYCLVLGKVGGATVYVDGIQKSYFSILGGNPYNPGTNIFLGGRSDLDVSRFLGGKMDEVRILSEPRSADWIATEYNNQNQAVDYLSISAQTTASLICSILPIELTSFTAKKNNNNIDLKWETASETNSNYFSIEKSEDAISFREINKVSASGNSSGQKNYTYTDTTPFNGINYFRLKSVDFDNSYSHSKIISIEFEETVKSVQLFPNPSTGIVNIKLEKNGSSTTHDIKIFNSVGHLISKFTIQNTNQTELDLRSLNKGFYFMEIDGYNKLKLMLE